MIRFSTVAGFHVALISALMAMPAGSRPIVAILSATLICFAFVHAMTNRASEVSIQRRPLLTLVALVAVWMLSLSSALLDGVTRIAPNQVIEVGLMVAVVWAVSRVDVDDILKSASLVCGLIFAASIGLALIGVKLFTSDNAYTATLILPLIYLRKRRTFTTFCLFAGVTAASYYLNARLMLTLAPLIWLSGSRMAETRKARTLAFIALASAIALNVYFTFNFSTAANEITTNRVMIWNIYGDEIAKRPLLGWSDTLSEQGQAVAQALSQYLDRGVGDAYGTQSMYVAYLYENGIVGFAVVMLLLTYALRKAGRFYYPLLLLLAAGLLETFRIGAPTIIGLPMTLLFFAAIAERRDLRQSDIGRSYSAIGAANAHA